MRMDRAGDHSVSQHGQSCHCLFETCAVHSTRAGSNLCSLQGAQNSHRVTLAKTVLLCVYVCAEATWAHHPSLNYSATPMSCISTGVLIKSSRKVFQELTLFLGHLPIRKPFLQFCLEIPWQSHHLKHQQITAN